MAHGYNLLVNDDDEWRGPWDVVVCRGEESNCVPVGRRFRFERGKQPPQEPEYS
jgi:hypothetical protein